MSKKREKFADKPQKEFDEVMLEVRRVTRVTTGGRQLSFRAIILVGNKKGKVGLGISKGADVQIAVSKATHDAYKNVITVPLTERGTIPYEICKTYKSAQVKLIPAAPGTGLKAGSSVRMVLNLVGCTNILSKIMGSPNKLNNALATIVALGSFKVGRFPKKQAETPEEITAELTPISTEAPKQPVKVVEEAPKAVDTKQSLTTKEAPVAKTTKKPVEKAAPKEKESPTTKKPVEKKTTTKKSPATKPATKKPTTTKKPTK